MTHPTDDSLKPCPFCGAGTTEITPKGRMWTGMKYSEPSSVSVRHWCEAVPGQPSRMIERVGRDEASAIDAWNTRALLAAQPAGAWMPTAENINALPEPLRDYVHQLEARCDPSGTVRENAQLKDVNKGLQIMYRNAADAAAQPAVQQPAEDAGLLDRHGKIRGDLKASAYCVGNEYKPFHPSASHVRPEWRDGWNACFVAAIKAQGGKQ